MRQLFGMLVIAALVATAGPLAATASFDLDSGRPMVQVTVNGKGPFPFVFDTGSPGLLVMRSLADELGLEVLGQTQLQSPLKGKPIDTQLVRVDSIALAGVAALGVEAKVLDMEGVGLGKGVVGPAVFREHGPVTIDFRSNTIALGKDAASDVETWVPLGDDAPFLSVPLKIGEVVIDSHIDTGSPGILTIPEGSEERLPLAGPVRTVGRGRTVDAEFEIRGAPIEESARVGDAVIPLQQVRIAELPKANLGTGALRGLVLHVDWENERLGLTGTAEPSEGGVRRMVRRSPGEEGQRRVVQEMSGGEGQRRMVRSTPAGGAPPFGIRGMPSPDGTIQIIDTMPDSPAEAIGLQAGDKIVGVNGKSTSELEHSQIRAELAKPNLELSVERNGETITLKRPH